MLDIDPSHRFQPFGPVHLTTMAVIVFLTIVSVLIVRNRKFQNWIEPLCGTLAIFLLGNELIWWIVALNLHMFSLRWGLPLQLCDLVIFLVSFSLIRYNQWVWELAYFWGLGATLQAVMTPDIQADFPHYYFFKFFITHGGVVMAVVILAAGLRRPISRSSMGRVWLITNIYAGIILIYNMIFQANYLYLLRKPSRPSLLDFFGPWPYYIFGLEFILIVSLVLYYAPYYFLEKIKSPKNIKDSSKETDVP